MPSVFAKYVVGNFKILYLSKFFNFVNKLAFSDKKLVKPYMPIFESAFEIF